MNHPAEQSFMVEEMLIRRDEGQSDQVEEEPVEGGGKKEEESESCGSNE